MIFSMFIGVFANDDGEGVVLCRQNNPSTRLEMQEKLPPDDLWRNGSHVCMDWAKWMLNLDGSQNIARNPEKVEALQILNKFLLRGFICVVSACLVYAVYHAIASDDPPTQSSPGGLSLDTYAAAPDAEAGITTIIFKWISGNVTRLAKAANTGANLPNYQGVLGKFAAGLAGADCQEVLMNAIQTKDATCVNGNPLQNAIGKLVPPSGKSMVCAYFMGRPALQLQLLACVQMMLPQNWQQIPGCAFIEGLDWRKTPADTLVIQGPERKLTVWVRPPDQRYVNPSPTGKLTSTEDLTPTKALSPTMTEQGSTSGSSSVSPPNISPSLTGQESTSVSSSVSPPNISPSLTGQASGTVSTSRNTVFPSISESSDATRTQTRASACKCGARCDHTYPGCWVPCAGGAGCLCTWSAGGCPGGCGPADRRCFTGGERCC